ncbi:hypothetical protein BJX62DRAFT_218806 [Aspergillus germanicus]
MSTEAVSAACTWDKPIQPLAIIIITQVHPSQFAIKPAHCGHCSPAHHQRQLSPAWIHSHSTFLPHTYTNIPHNYTSSTKTHSTNISLYDFRFTSPAAAALVLVIRALSRMTPEPRGTTVGTSLSRDEKVEFFEGKAWLKGAGYVGDELLGAG